MLVVVGETAWLPEVALAPDQAPEAEQDVAFALFHDRVLLEPGAIEEGLALRETDGGCGVVDPGGTSGIEPEHTRTTRCPTL